MHFSETISGIQFPRAQDGRRSSTAASEAILAAAAQQLDPAFAAAIRSERNWRKNYRRYLVKFVQLAFEKSDMATGLVNDGLTAVHETFRFFRDGERMTPREAMRGLREEIFHTGCIEGIGQRSRTLEVPYRGKLLRDDSLRRQMDQWVAAGVMEPSAAAAIAGVAGQPEWLDLRDQYFVLLGAAAEIGPAETLSNLGANVVAVDLGRPEIWENLLRIARAGAGRMLFPLRKPQSSIADDAGLTAAAGADLLTMAPEIRTWLASLDRALCIGGYAYLHGQDHVRVEVAMDAIMEDLAAQRNDVALAFLPTPTDVFVIPYAAAVAARQNFASSGASRLWRTPLHQISRGRLYAANAERDLTDANGNRYGLYDGVVPQQGPNYALAKRIQKWRALSARAAGHRVSVNVAPSTATSSVLSRPEFKAAYAGAGHYGVEIFEPATTNAIMTALLVHDLRNDNCAANPSFALPHPLELFMDGAVHGGVWRAGYQLRSVLEIAALRGFVFPAQK